MMHMQALEQGTTQDGGSASFALRVSSAGERDTRVKVEDAHLQARLCAYASPRLGTGKDFCGRFIPSFAIVVGAGVLKYSSVHCAGCKVANTGATRGLDHER